MNALRLLLILSIFANSVLAEAVKDREGAVRKDRATMENDARWIYNDFERGFAEAKRTGKPLLVVLRCVPCLSCMGIDASVLAEPALVPLLDQFVCVRLINANAIDLARFQFDYDLSFTTMFFNGDGTVYGRYGSWVHQKDSQDKTTAGYQRALEAVLTIHRGYPANKAALGGKQGGPTPFKTPIEIPELAEKYKRDLDWDGKVVSSCVHCHQVADAFRASFRQQKKPIPSEWIYPQPSPETIGMTLAPDRVARVVSIADGSPAAKAGMQAGDDIVLLAGQPVVSIADVNWVLHRAPDSASLAGVVRRNGAEKSLTVELPSGWRSKADISRRVGTWQMRGMVAGGLSLEDLGDDARRERGLDAQKMALFVKAVGQYGTHAAARNAGFQKEDVIVEFAGDSRRMTESQVLGWLLQNHLVGERVKATVLRGQQRIELSMPMQ